MISSRDPIAMTASERLDRVAGLLAVAILRLALRREKELELRRRAEAPCVEPVNAEENKPVKEST